MKRLTLLALALVVMALTLPMKASAQTGAPCGFVGLQGFAFETLTVSTTALPLTATVYAPAGQRPADVAIVSIEGSAVRYRDDGIPPTAALGQKVLTNGGVTVCNANVVQRFQMIRQAAADGTAMVNYYRVGQ